MVSVALVVNGFGVYTMMPLKLFGIMDGNSLWLCNGYYAQQGIDVCINRDLIESFADSDIRKGLFLTESTFLPEDGSQAFLDVVSQTSRNANNFNHQDRRR